jgi:bacterioferritin
MKDEEHHIDFLETELDLASKLGYELYQSTRVGELDH